MKITRRDLTFLLPLLAAADASAQSSPTPSKTYDYATLDVRVNGANKQRFFFDASTRTGFTVRVHETELAPNQMPHASHHAWRRSTGFRKRPLLDSLARIPGARESCPCTKNRSQGVASIPMFSLVRTRL